MDYDWDTVEIGRPEWNSSQNFFRELKLSLKFSLNLDLILLEFYLNFKFFSIY